MVSVDSFLMRIIGYNSTLLVGDSSSINVLFILMLNVFILLALGLSNLLVSSFQKRCKCGCRTIKIGGKNNCVLKQCA